MGLRRAPGQERYLGSMISHFEDAIADARACPRDVVRPRRGRPARSSGSR